MKHRLSLITICVVTLCLSGCGGTDARAGSGAAPTGETTFLSYEDYVREYDAAKAELRFPGSYPTARSAVQARPAEPGVWQAGSGEVDAAMEWSCAWAAETVNADTPADRRRALESYNEIRTLELWDDDTFNDVRRVATKAISDAEIGQLGEMQSIAAANCSDLLR